MTRKTPGSFLMKKTDFDAAYAWARGLCLMMFGLERGEAYFKTIPAIVVLEAWAARNRQPIVAEA